MDTSVPRVTVLASLGRASLYQNNDPWDIFVHPYLTLMSDSHIAPKCIEARHWNAMDVITMAVRCQHHFTTQYFRLVHVFAAT